MSGAGARARRLAAVPSDKAYAVEARLNDLGLYNDASSQNNYVNSNDGNTYISGRLATWVTANGGISIVSSTPSAVAGMSVNAGGAAAQRYTFRLHIGYQAHTGSTDNPYLVMAGSVSPSFFFATIDYGPPSAATALQTTATFGSNTGLGGSAMVSLQKYSCHINGLILVPGGSGGTLLLWAASSSTAGYLISEGSFFELTPV